jgi:ribose 5-phosphate isomerase
VAFRSNPTRPSIIIPSFTAARAAFLGLPVVVPNERPRIDLSIDGADEVDRELRLLKGRPASTLVHGRWWRLTQQSSPVR